LSAFQSLFFTVRSLFFAAGRKPVALFVAVG